MKIKISLIILLLIGVVGCSQTNTTSSENNLLEKVKAEGVLKVGVEGTFPPYTYHNQDELVGFDVEVAELVAEKLGVKVEFTEAKWDSLIAGLDVNQYDVVINNVAITQEREEKYDFSNPYSYSKSILAVNGDNEDINSFEDLKDKISAQTLTSNFAGEAEEHGAQIVGTNGFAESIELVVSGRAEATIISEATMYDYLEEHPDANLRIIEERGRVVPIGIIFEKGNVEFKDTIDEILNELKEEGKLSEVSIKYFGFDITQE